MRMFYGRGRWAALLVAALLTASAAACSDDGPTGNGNGNGNGNGARVDTLDTDILGVRTLSADTTYIIVGFLEVEPGGQLIVPAGTTLISDPNTRGSIVTLRCSGDQPSGQLIVQGTATNPVTFGPPDPSAQAAIGLQGVRARGQAGGIVLHGCAPINVPGGTGVSEGVARPFGGTNTGDSSGDISYLVIEFGGVPVTPDNEINGLTLAGVGSGTLIDHVQTHFIADDGFEWFGGTANASFLVSSGNDDDAFDCDFGWNGTVQFTLAIQATDRANRGLECDNDAAGSANAPITDPKFWNGTWIGNGQRLTSSDVNDGLYIRRNAAGEYQNHVIANFGNVGVVLDGGGSLAQLTSGNLILDNVLFFNNLGLESGATGTDNLTRNVQRRASGAYTIDQVAAALAGGAFVFADPQFQSVTFTNPINGSQPDPRPAAGSPALDAASAETPSGPGIVDPSADYLGAFSADNWIAGWTDWATN